MKQNKVLYHVYFDYDDDLNVLGEAEGFFELTNNKLKYITGWFCGDANYREEYMGDIITYFGGEIKLLPAKYKQNAAALMAEACGLV